MQQDPGLSKLLDVFRELEIDAISESQFCDIAQEFLEDHKQTYPTFQAALDTVPVYTALDVLLSSYCLKHNISYPFSKKIQQRLKEHEFFKSRAVVCAAPYTSLRFEFNGNMTVCCNNREYNIGNYLTTTPLEAWKGERMSILRNALKNYDFSKGCMSCARHILNNNGANTVLKNHDKFLPDVKKDMPSHLVFQLHNTCNYECIMCGGEYSSSIRKNREKLPAIPCTYDDNFIDNVKVFLEHASTAEFLGGEPFITTINYRIWDVLKTVNPDINLELISNGSYYNSKIEDTLLAFKNASVFISIDTVNPELYSSIRRNGNLENVLSNIDKFIAIKKLKGLSVCPLIQNIYDIPNVIEFCIKKDVGLWINDVQTALGAMYEGIHTAGNVPLPCESKLSKNDIVSIPEFRLWTLPKDEIKKIILFLRRKTYPKHYQDRLEGLINNLLSMK